jgi:hypothetical protein
MIGIYQDSFLDYLRSNLGQKVKITTKNIIVPCPWCEYKKDKDHYHLYISLEMPIFHCFHASCERSGNLSKFIRQLHGTDITDTFVDKDKIREYQREKNLLKESFETKRLKLPPLNSERFKLKELYIKKRLKFAPIPTETIKGLIYDINSFIEMNHIPIPPNLFRILDYLQSNFVGFLTENHCTLVCRNINSSHSMRYYKVKIADSYFVDYYKLSGNDPKSKKIVLAEGVFDIFAEQIYDSLKIKNDVRMYASCFNSKYSSLIQSIVYYEQLFRPDVVILSDRGVEMDWYRKMYFFNSHIINSLSIYMNVAGKDFNDVPVEPRRISINEGAKFYGKRKRKT